MAKQLDEVDMNEVKKEYANSILDRITTDH